MAKYHVTINSSYWLQHYPEFRALPPRKRMELVRRDSKRIQDYLESEPQDDVVSILLTAEDISIVPIDDTEANGRVLRIK